MTVWPVRTLGEVCEVARGTSITRKETKEGMIPVVAGGIDVAYFHSVQNRPAGTITVSSSGANAGFVNRWDVPIFASDCSTVVAKEGGMVFGDYAFRFLQFKQNFINAELRRGAAQPHVYAKDIAAIEIPVPPIEEQKRIVELLDAATARIAELTACYEQARTHANNLFASALRGVLESNPDWPVKTLGEVAKWGSGGTPQSGVAKYYGGDIPWCVIGDLTESDVWVTERSITEEGLLNSSAKIVDVGAVLIAMYGASIGRTGVVRTRMATNQAIAFAYANQEIVHSDFLLMFLQSQKQRFIDAGQGAAQPNISQLVLKEWPISLPPLGEQKRIVARLDSMRAKTSEMVAAYDAKLTAAKNLRQSILEAAFAGDL